MVSATVNVIRYTALLTGVFYGIVHRRTLQTAKNVKHEHDARHHQESLVEKAKEAWKQKQLSKGGDGVITNPEDPKFDLEKLLAKFEKDS